MQGNSGSKTGIYFVYIEQSQEIQACWKRKKDNSRDTAIRKRQKISMEFCPICYKQTEKEIWKKENRFTEIRWVFCPNHGYIKDDKQRTALNLKIQPAKRRRIHAKAKKRSAAIKQAHIFLLSRGLITSVLCIIVSLCMVLGYFVGMRANRPKDIIYSIHVGSFNKDPRAEHSKHGLLQRDITHASFESIDPFQSYTEGNKTINQ